MADPSECPCGSGRAYAACCGPLHAGAEAPDAVALMRSRYSAFVRGEHDYLWKTLHADHDDRRGEKKLFLQRLERNAKRTRYHGLTVLEGEGADAAGVARVLFAARVKHGGKDASFVELSSFVHDGVGWRYLAGRTFALSGLGDPSRLRIADLDRL